MDERAVNELRRLAALDAELAESALTLRGLDGKVATIRGRAEAIDAALESLDGDDSETLLRLIEDLTAAITRFRLRARARRDEPAAWLCRLCDFGACGRPEGRCPAANAARGG